MKLFGSLMTTFTYINICQLHNQLIYLISACGKYMSIFALKFGYKNRGVNFNVGTIQFFEVNQFSSSMTTLTF